MIVPQLCIQHDGGVITCTDCFEYGGDTYCWTRIIRPVTLF